MRNLGMCTARLRKLCAKAVAPINLDRVACDLNTLDIDELRDVKRVEDAALNAKVLQLQMAMAKQLTDLETLFCSNVLEMTRQLTAAIESERSQASYSK
ncbi:hypothetical protein H310_00440 [Aphanomyces invadans]|uniref:Uncharacterized protein n=1 Tax=Aphanomyces invadans TaxID=157072 RepID=A0A024UU51_9STRA|nr:hypothetical protein H310_00440 [Aphanomyces invadans]ETW10051.1 hypothetical protein H310_00440 [Aphanomyces invadans]|eukprot:XP_008861462.1 hypothetical protein H310_00440 [Aphanomyces invadans]